MAINEDMNQVLRRKSSFGRFGDDLTELIISYLPTEDKFRFQCLSRQIQTLVFNKHLILKISSEDPLGQSIAYHPFRGLLFDYCLKKLNLLSELHIDYKIVVNSYFLQTIADNCHHLRRISLQLNPILDNNSIERFGQKCGQKLQSLSVLSLHDSFDKIRHLLSMTPQLVSLKVMNRLTEHIFTSGSNVLTKLQEFDCNRIAGRDLMALMDNYSGQLVRLRLIVSSGDVDWLTIERFLCGHYPRLQSLDLTLHCMTKDWLKTRHLWTKLAANCPQLKRLSVCLSLNLPSNESYLSLFSSFTSLTSLDIKLLDDYFLNPNYGSFKELKQLSELRHLKLCATKLSDNHLQDIGQYLPQLVSLSVKTDVILSDNSLIFISQLKQLKSLAIYCDNNELYPDIRDPAVKQLLNNCSDIRRLVLLSWNQTTFVISADIIQLFRERAEKYPKTNYYLGFWANYPELLTEDLRNLPGNLLVEPRQRLPCCSNNSGNGQCCN